jgi:hypothetical protein
MAGRKQESPKDVAERRKRLAELFAHHPELTVGAPEGIEDVRAGRYIEYRVAAKEKRGV